MNKGGHPKLLLCLCLCLGFVTPAECPEPGVVQGSTARGSSEHLWVQKVKAQGSWGTAQWHFPFLFSSCWGARGEGAACFKTKVPVKGGAEAVPTVGCFVESNLGMKRAVPVPQLPPVGGRQQ